MYEVFYFTHPSTFCIFVLKGINKGSSIFLYILKQLGILGGERQVAFYHRNTSDARKQEILQDLQLPLSTPSKKLLAVVATVSLGKVTVHRVKT